MRRYLVAVIVVVVTVLVGSYVFMGCALRDNTAPGPRAAYWKCLTLYDGGVEVAQYTPLVTDQPKYFITRSSPIRFHTLDGKHVWSGAYLLSERRCER